MIGPRLKNLGRWFSGGTPPSERSEYWEGDVPWLSGKDFDKTVLREPTKFTTEEGAALHSRLMPGGRSVLLLVRGMALAHGLPVARLPFDAAINQDVRGLRVGVQFDPDFVYYAFVGRSAELNAHIDRAAHGTARLLETVYSHRIAWMPELTAQRMIVDSLDRECDRIAAALASLDAPVVTASRLPTQRLLEAIAALGARDERLRFGMMSLSQGWSPECWDRQRGAGEWGVLKLGCVNGGVFTSDHKTLPPDVVPRPKLEVRAGDLLMSRANTRGLVGSAAVVGPNAGPRLMLSDLLYRLRLDPERWHPPYVAAFLNSPIGRAQIESGAALVGGLQNRVIWALWACDRCVCPALSVVGRRGRGLGVALSRVEET